MAIGRLAGWLFLGGSVIALPADLPLRSASLLTAIMLSVMGAVSGVICLRLRWERVSERFLIAAGVIGTIEVTISVIAVGAHGPVLEPI